MVFQLFIYFLFINLYFFLPLGNAYAYIDPGGISAFIQILFASILTGIVFLRNYVFSFFSNIKNFYIDIIEYLKFNSLKKETVIFCESNSYSIYFEELLNKANQNKINFIYLCEYADENIIKSNIKRDNFYQFHNQFFLTLIISNLKCENLILTTPDFGNGNLKLSKNCKKIIYFFHSIVSSNMIYNEKAFDNYDIICCVGNHHNLEFKEHFSSSGLIKKNLLECGYPYLDQLLKSSKENSYEKNHILIAPTWYPKNPNFYHENYSHLTAELLKNNFKITFRPHPEFLKRFEVRFNEFCENFEKNSNFKIDKSKSNLISMEKCEYLITDWSGIAFEFAYTYKRPVIFIEVPKKILNKNYLNFSNKPIEITDREEIGVILNSKNLQDIFGLINNLKEKEHDVKSKIEKNLNKNVYNLKNSSQKIIDIIS